MILIALFSRKGYCINIFTVYNKTNGFKRSDEEKV